MLRQFGLTYEVTSVGYASVKEENSYRQVLARPKRPRKKAIFFNCRRDTHGIVVK